MHCDSCYTKVKLVLLKNKNIKELVFNKNIITIMYEEELEHKKIINDILELGYITKEEYFNKNKKSNIKISEFILIVISFLLIIFLLNKIFGFNIFNVIPPIDSNLTYGMLFVTGLLTSIHCISMCGGINLIASTGTDDTKRNFKKPLLYNLGRLISYTLLGGIIGLIGKILSINYIVMGIVIIISAILMLLMALSMMGIIKFRLPKLIKFKSKNTNSFIIGLANGFMPCGPLQTMQLYALGLGSFFKGALALFLFGLGTIPLMLLVGVVYNLVKGKRKIIINKISSVLVLLLSLIMINRGLLMLDIDISKLFNDYKNYESSVIIDNYQLIEFDLKTSGYEDIIIQNNIPVKMIIHVTKENLTGCNNEIIIKEYGIDKVLVVGDNVIEFTPTKTGTYLYTCYMVMIKNNIKVIDDISYFNKES